MSLSHSPLPRLFLVSASAIILLTPVGCSNMTPTASRTNSFANASGEITGSIHGGNQPVSGADVRLYAAGVAGYGSAPTLYATTSTANDGSGSFSFSKQDGVGNSASGTKVYSCPSDGTDPWMYIFARGGSTQGAGNGTNDAAAFIVALGTCSTIGDSTFVDMNEVTTVATMAALQQYFRPGNATSDGLDHIGMPASATAKTAFANSVGLISKLANVARGTALPTTTLTATPTGATGPVTVTLTSEAAKINTIADILAACVNTTDSSSQPCITLFENANPPSASTTSQPMLDFNSATDTVQAAYYILTNPANGGSKALTALFNLVPGQAPFEPVLTSAPTDWTIGIRYSSTSACSSGTFLTGASSVVSSADGTIFIAGGSPSGNLMALSNTGQPAVCALGTSVASSKGLAIDTNGNVWIAGNAANSPFYKFAIDGGSTSTWPVPAGSVPYAVGADGNGNVFYTDATNTALYEFAGGAATGTPTSAVKVATVGSLPYLVAADTAGRVFVTNSGGLYDVYPSTSAGNTNGFLTTMIGTSANVVSPYTLAAGTGGSIFYGNSASSSSPAAQTAGYFTPGDNGTATFSANTPQYAGGISNPSGPSAVDGAGNIWFADSLTPTGNYVTGSSYSSGHFAVTELSASNNALSPSSTLSTGNNAGFQKDATIFASAPRGVAIDPSGNVWVGSNSPTANGVVEIVGAAVPVVTPVSAGLAAGALTTNAVQLP